MEIKVNILTEGSSSIGFGHVTRCLSISQAFEEFFGIEPEIFINGDRTVLSIIGNRKINIVDWLSDEDIQKAVFSSDIVIIDSYLADKDFYGKVSYTVDTPVFIDDNMRIDYPEGIIINGNIYASELDYPRKENTVYLLGTRYTPLRKVFWEVPEKNVRDKIQNIMVTFGGDDIRNMTPQVMDILRERFPDVKKTVIIGMGFKNLEEIKRKSDPGTELVFYPDGKVMRDVMLEADIAITAGGQTLYELARTGTPAVSVIVADNQIRNVNGWEKAGFVVNAGMWNDRNVLPNIVSGVETLISIEERKKRSLIGRSAIDGKGSRNIAAALLRHFIHKNSEIRKIKEGDIWDIYEISSSKEVRKVSFSNKPIERNEHIQWFRNVPRECFYVFDVKGKVLGFVRIEEKEGENIVSIAVHPGYHGLGIGKKLLGFAVKKCRKKPLIAYIKKHNSPSIGLFSNTGFSVEKETDEIIRMIYTGD
ncbi:GNAT family N-acetyltransferase [Persephonella sp.]